MEREGEKGREREREIKASDEACNQGDPETVALAENVNLL